MGRDEIQCCRYFNRIFPYSLTAVVHFGPPAWPGSPLKSPMIITSAVEGRRYRIASSWSSDSLNSSVQPEQHGR